MRRRRAELAKMPEAYRAARRSRLRAKAGRAGAAKAKASGAATIKGAKS